MISKKKPPRIGEAASKDSEKSATSAIAANVTQQSMPPRKATCKPPRKKSPPPPRRQIITVPHYDSMEFVELVEYLQLLGLCVVPSNKDAIPMCKYGELPDTGLPADDNKWNRAKMISIRLDSLVLIDLDRYKDGGIDEDKLAPLMPGALKFQWKEDGSSEHWLCRLPLDELPDGIKNSSDGFISHVDLKRGVQLMHIKPGKKLDLSVLARLARPSAALIKALTDKRAAKRQQVEAAKAGNIDDFIPSRHIPRLTALIHWLNDNGYFLGSSDPEAREGIDGRDYWLRAIGCLKNFIGTEHEAWALEMVDVIDDGEGTTLDKLNSEHAAVWHRFLDAEAEMREHDAPISAGDLAFDDEETASKKKPPRRQTGKQLPQPDRKGVKTAAIALGDWASEKHTAKGDLIYVLAQAGTVAKEIINQINRGKFMLARSYNGAVKGDSSHGIMLYDAAVGIWRPWENLYRFLCEEADRQRARVNGNPDNWVTGDAWVMELIRCIRGQIAVDLQPPSGNLIPFANGCYVVSGPQAGRFIDHHPSHFLVNTNDIHFDDKAPAHAPATNAFLEYAADGNAGKLAAMKAALAAVLRGEQTKTFIEFIGESDSGKTVMARLCSMLVGGDDNIFVTDMDMLAGANRSNFRYQNLPGKRLIMMAEQDSGKFGVGDLKKLTGGDPITVEVKGGNAYPYQNIAPIVITGNSPISFKGEFSQAITNRRVLINMDRVVAKKDQDPRLLEKMSAELGGFVQQLLAVEDIRGKLARHRETDTAVHRANIDTDHNYEFASLLVPVEGDFKKHAWYIGSAPSAADLRNNTVHINRHAGLYPIYVHWCHATGNQRSIMNQRIFQRVMMNNLKTLHRSPVFKVPHNMMAEKRAAMMWQPGEELLSMFSTSLKPEMEFED